MQSVLSEHVTEYDCEKYIILKFSKFMILIDFEDKEIINGKKWKMDDKHLVSYNNDHSYLYFHKLLNTNFGDKPYLVHLNGINYDFRKKNLEYFNASELRRYYGKKDKSIPLPIGCGISVKEIPQYMYYNSRKNTFRIQVYDNKHVEMCKETTTFPELTLKQKFIITKLKYKHFLTKNPDFFEKNMLNGDLSEVGFSMYNSFFDIFESTKIIPPVKKENKTNNTQKLLYTNDDEILEVESVYNHQKLKLPIDSGLTYRDMPKYVTYKTPKNRTPYFTYDKRQGDMKINFVSSSSKKLGVKEKLENIKNKIIENGYEIENRNLCDFD